MKPVLVLQHLHQDGPAYLGTWLQRHGAAFRVFNTEAGQDFPAHIAGYSALAVLGGEMSANDELPSLRRAEQLIVQAMAADVPVLGLCLGAQLMARAMGARVVASPAPEIGWQTVQVRSGPEARLWLGPGTEITVFHWHYDSFELPAGAAWLAQTAACPHQAFCLGPHLGVQFHPELDAAKLQAWVDADDARYEALQAGASVQTGAEMLWAAPTSLPLQQRLADHLYTRWLSAAR